MRLPFDTQTGHFAAPEYLDLVRRQPTIDVELPDGTAAIAVTRYCDIRTVLSDNRFSRAQFHVSTASAGSDLPLALVTSDPPIHTLRRRAIQGWFTTRRAERARPLIERVANQLIDDLLAAGPPADIYARFCQPFPNLVHMNLLGLDAADLPYLAPLITVAWSSGHYCTDEVAKANFDLREYFAGQVSRSRSRRTSGGLIDALVHDESANRLDRRRHRHAHHGSAHVGRRDDQQPPRVGSDRGNATVRASDALRRNPDQIPSAVEELLRWVWFGGTIGGTAGRAHVATADVKLRDRLISKGEVVVPIIDVANRDPEVFAEADEFCPKRSPNPHLAFGHGRHRCVGMAFARVELQVGLQVVLSRLDGLTLVTGSEIDWRTQMFTRGVWSLPVTWRGGG